MSRQRYVPMPVDGFREFLPSGHPKSYTRLLPLYLVLANTLRPDDHVLDTTYVAVAESVVGDRETVMLHMRDLADCGLIAIEPRKAGRRHLGVRVKVFFPELVRNGVGAVVCKALHPFRRTLVAGSAFRGTLAKHLADLDAMRKTHDEWHSVWVHPSVTPGNVAKLIYEEQSGAAGRTTRERAPTFHRAPPVDKRSF